VAVIVAVAVNTDGQREVHYPTRRQPSPAFSIVLQALRLKS
jgi:hypothetical protein